MTLVTCLNLASAEQLWHDGRPRT